MEYRLVLFEFRNAITNRNTEFDGIDGYSWIVRKN
jgi:hypothetical protein